MNWFVLSLISALSISLREFCAKKLGRDFPALLISCGFSLFAFFTFLCISLFIGNYYPITSGFLKLLLTASIMDAGANLMYISAIKNGELSKTVPMLCFIPVIQLFVTPVLIHENLSFTGALGVLVVVSGSYLLHVNTRTGLLSPFKAVFKDRNAMLMLAAACIWGVSSSFHKMGIQKSDVLFWVVCEYGLISLIFLPFAYRAGRAKVHLPKLTKIILPACFSSVAALSYFAGISLGPVAYVSSIRRLGVLFSIFLGIMFFKEGFKVPGFVGGLVMIVGAVIISLFG